MKKWKSLVKLLFTATFVFTLFIWFDFQSIYKAIGNVSWWLYLLVIAGHFVLMGIKALRWYFLLHSLQIPCSYSQALKAYVVGFSFGTFTPGQLGDMGKLMLIPGSKGQRGKAFVSTVADRAWDLAGLVFVTIGSGLLLYSSEIKTNNLKVGLIVFCIILLFLPLCYFLVKKLIWRQFDMDIGELFRFWQWSFLLTAFALTIQCLRWVVLALALKLPVISTAAIAMTGTLVALIPVSFGGLGTREATIAVMFSHNGLDPVVGVSFSFLMFGSYLVGAFSGAFLLYVTE